MVFTCDLCDKGFKFKSKLNDHLDNKNPCNKPKESTECQICDKKFTCLAKLERHKNSKKHIANVTNVTNDNVNIETQNINITNNIVNQDIKMIEENIKLFNVVKLKKLNEYIKKIT